MATRIAAARALTSEVVQRATCAASSVTGARRDGEEHRDGHVLVRRATRPCRSTAATATCASTVVERLYRDARLYPIGGGTREIMNEIISKTEGY